jgi:hypothetical protein
MSFVLISFCSVGLAPVLQEDLIIAINHLKPIYLEVLLHLTRVPECAFIQRTSAGGMLLRRMSSGFVNLLLPARKALGSYLGCKASSPGGQSNEIVRR